MVLPETQVSGVVQNHPATDVMSAPQYVTSEEISQKNTGDGNITDLMKTNPAVQFANNDSNSMNQGKSSLPASQSTVQAAIKMLIALMVLVLIMILTRRQWSR